VFLVGGFGFPEEEWKARGEDIRDRFVSLRNTALDALIDLIGDIKDAKQKGATDAPLAPARDTSGGDSSRSTS